LETKTQLIWQTAENPIQLTLNQVHIWRARMNASEAEIVNSRNHLSEEECERADRFKFDIHRNRFIISHAILRKILSRYINIPPEKIIYQVNDHGKPSLVESQNELRDTHSEKHTHTHIH